MYIYHFPLFFSHGICDKKFYGQLFDILHRFGVYILTFGCTANPYSHSVLFKLGTHQSQHIQDLITNNTSLFHQAVTLQSISVTSITQIAGRSKSKMYESNGTVNPEKNTENNHLNGHVQNGLTNHPTVQENCSMSPDGVRYEAECLRTDFNLRMKQILFNSLVSAYYVGFVPVKFTQVCIS